MGYETVSSAIPSSDHLYQHSDPLDPGSGVLDLLVSGRHQQLKELATRYQAEWLPSSSDWLILTEGILLLVAILIGIYVIFIYWRRQASLNKAQRHFINQVSHELKSPLASLQLHLETIQLRQPTPAQLQKFTALMQEDTKRLNTLINNLLTAGKIEHKGAQLNLEVHNLSRLLEEYLYREKERFPAEGTLGWEIESGLLAKIEPEAMATVMRNLLENAILYADGPPVVSISLGLSVYADTLTETLNHWAEGEGGARRVSAEGGTDSDTGLAMVTIYLSKRVTPYRNRIISSELAGVLSEFQKHTATNRGTLKYERDVLFFQGDVIQHYSTEYPNKLDPYSRSE